MRLIRRMGENWLHASARIAISSGADNKRKPTRMFRVSMRSPDKQDQTVGAIMAHIMLPKHPMPTIPLTKSELANLAAYILSLREKE